MRPDTLLDLPHPLECHIPAVFEFGGHQSIFRISSIILSLRSLSCIPCCLEITIQRFSYVITALGRLLTGRHGRIDGSWLYNSTSLTRALV